MMRTSPFHFLMRRLSRGLIALSCLLFIPCPNAHGQGEPGQNGPCTDSLAQADLTMGEDLIARSRRDSAEVVLQRAAACARRLDARKILARSLVALGRIELGKIGPRDKPTKLFLEALSIYTELGDDRGIASCNLQLGVLSFDIKNYLAAEQYFQHVLKAEGEGKRFQSVARYLLALSYSELGKFDLAEQTFDLAAGEVAKSDSMFHLQVLTFKGKMYANQGAPEKAIALLDQVLKDFRPTIEKEAYAPVYAFLSSAHFQAGNLRDAIANGERAFALCKANTSNSIYLRETENTLHQAYRQSGNYPKAYYYLHALQVLDDSVFNVQALQRVAQMSGEFEFEQQRKLAQAEQALKDQLARQELARQKRMRNLLLLGFLSVTAFAIIFLRQRRRIAMERDRSEKLLLNILPEEVAEELKTGGSAEAVHFDKVTVLFTDFKGFTAMSEQMTPQELVHDLHECFSAFDKITEKYGIEKIKTIGDAYMAAGGLPTPNTTHAVDVVKAALEMTQFVEAGKVKKIAAGRPFFEIRVGIHTGPVVAGIVGVKKFQYDIWGDTVNTAARMESSGAVGKVNISESTYALLKDDPGFAFTSRGKIEAKGKGEIAMYFVEAAARA